MNQLFRQTQIRAGNLHHRKVSHYPSTLSCSPSWFAWSAVRRLALSDRRRFRSRTAACTRPRHLHGIRSQRRRISSRPLRPDNRSQESEV